LKRKCIAVLDQVFPEYSNLFTDTFGISSKTILKEYSTPEELASIHTTKLTNLLKKASKGRFGKEKALEVKAVAKQSIGITFATDAFAFQMKQILEQLEFIEEQVKLLDQQIEEYMEN